MADAWYLNFDGINDYVEIPTLSVLGTDDFAVEFRFPANTNTDFHRPIGGVGTAINSRVLIFSSGTWRLTSAANVNRNWSISARMNDDVVVRWQRVSGQLDLLIDGVVQSGGFSGNTDAYDFARIGSNTGASTVTIASKCYYMNFEVNGVLQREYKNNVNATQTVFPELANSQDGTLFGFGSPPDWVLYADGGGGVTATITESSPAFADSINTTVTGVTNTAQITELLPAFIGSVNATVTGNLTANITEQSPSFNGSVTASVVAAGVVSANIIEIAPTFTGSISATLTQIRLAEITGQAAAFSDIVNVSISGIISSNIVELSPAFSASLTATVPSKWIDIVAPDATWTDRTNTPSTWVNIR